MNHQAKRPTSTPTISDYTTQGDPDASPSNSNLFRSNVTNDEFLGTNNFFMPDGSNRQIHQIDNKVFHAGYLENGNNAYLLELPALEKMLNMQKLLMDEMSGQFYAVYGNSYQRMSMKPMLQQAWATGELIYELAATRQAFGYTGLAGSTPPLAMGMQPTASTSRQPDDLLPRQPAPKTVQYQPPSFKLTRLTTCLMMNERIQVHHNYISAVSSLEHKKDLINRLKRSDTHNISAYKAEMSCHMTLHEDVLERILNILKQDNYYRTLEDLPVIDGLRAYDDIRLLPELYDTSTIIERITGEADLIERQLRRSGVYPQPTNPSPSTSTSAPKPTSIFEPSSPQQLKINKAQNLHLKVHYPVDREHLQHRLALQTHHLYIHLHCRLYTHNINPRSLHPHITHHRNPINNKFNKHLLKQMLTSLLSLPFQMKNISVFPN